MACPVYNPLSFYGDKDKTIMFKFKTFKKWGARIKSLQIGSRKADNQSATPNTPPYKNSTSGVQVERCRLKPVQTLQIILSSEE